MNNSKYESIGGCPSVGISDRLARTFVYIDGFNLYHAVNKFQNKSFKKLWQNSSYLLHYHKPTSYLLRLELNFLLQHRYVFCNF